MKSLAPEAGAGPVESSGSGGRKSGNLATHTGVMPEDSLDQPAPGPSKVLLDPVVRETGPGLPEA